MENKYYVPDITEFRVGFEYEEYDGVEWIGSAITLWTDLKNLFDCTDKCPVPTRVKYLDTSDIESFGFNHIGALWFENIEKSYRIRKWKGNEVDIYKWWIDGDNNLIFRGKIKNKSELQQVLKMIGVIG